TSTAPPSTRPSAWASASACRRTPCPTFRTSCGGTARPPPDRTSPGERAGEAQLVTVGVVDVEVALTPGRVRGRHQRREPRRDSAVVHLVDVADPEDHPSPCRR